MLSSSPAIHSPVVSSKVNADSGCASRIDFIAASCSGVGSAFSKDSGSPIIFDCFGKATMEYFSYCFSGRSNSSWLIIGAILPCTLHKLRVEVNAKTLFNRTYLAGGITTHKTKYSSSCGPGRKKDSKKRTRSEEHTSELQSRGH